MSKTKTTTAGTRPAEDRAINKLAREWAQFVGGFKQAQKIVREAFELGQQFANGGVE